MSGYSGIGKSSVVHELHKVLVPPRGLFASGKFDQYKRDIPYATLAQAFESLIRPLLSKSEAELRNWRDALREALGPNGLLMVDLVPELKLIIGEQPPVPELPPQDAQNRFQLVFRRFLGVFARPEHPLALFLDDLQWLDEATLDFLEDLLTQPEVHHSCWSAPTGTTRSTPPTRCCASLKRSAKRARTCKRSSLRPCSAKIWDITRGFPHCEPTRATPLAQLVHEKTAGNPFFAFSSFMTLVEEGLLDLRSRRRAMVMGPKSHSRQGLHRQCGGSHGW